MLLMSSVACKKINTMNGKYKWLVETVADYGYPMEIKGGGFMDEKGEILAGIPADMYLNGQWWNGDSGSMVTGEEFRPLPSVMTIRWFSYAEDKFYQGKFTLDHKKLEEEFNKIFPCNFGKYSYSAIKVALAPGGQVFLYLTGPNMKLLGSYQAEEIVVPDFREEMGITADGVTRKESVGKRVAKMPASTQREIQQGSIRKDIWKNINKTYPWKYTYEIAGDNRPLKILDRTQGADFISGEQTWCLENEDYFTQSIPKAVPLEIDARFKTEAGRELTVYLYIGHVNGVEPKMQTYEVQRAREQELVQLFAGFYEKIGKEEFSIHLKINDDLKTGRLYLKRGNTEQEIPNVQIEIYDETFDK